MMMYKKVLSDIVGRVGAPIDLTATEEFDTAT